MRYQHGVIHDPVHDEMIATEPLTSAILVFKGGADGKAAPIRVIQGGKTRLHGPWQVALDLEHDEIWVADFMMNDIGGILAFSRTANGNVAPLRVIAGPKTTMARPTGVAVDPERNLIVVATLAKIEAKSHGLGGLFVFNRTDNGDVAPRQMIAGPHTGIYSGWHVAVYGGRIFATIANLVWKPAYDLGGFSCRPGVTGPPQWVWTHPPGFVGVWRETDNGDVPPWGVIGGYDTGLYCPFGLVIEPKLGEVMVTDQRNQVETFLVPQLFGPIP